MTDVDDDAEPSYTYFDNQFAIQQGGRFIFPQEGIFCPDDLQSSLGLAVAELLRQEKKTPIGTLCLPTEERRKKLVVRLGCLV